MSQFLGLRQGLAGYGGIDLVHDGLKRRVLALARMTQAHGHLGHDVARIFVHDHDPVGHQHGLFDIVRDHQDRLGGDGFAQPQLHQLAAQRFGGEHIQRGKRLVQAQQLRLDRHRPRKAHLLPHAAGKLPRIGGFETVQPDRVDQLHCARCRRSGGSTPRP